MTDLLQQCVHSKLESDVGWRSSKPQMHSMEANMPTCASHLSVFLKIQCVLTGPLGVPVLYVIKQAADFHSCYSANDR